MTGIIDTTVIVHLYRRDPAAFAWFNMQLTRHLVTPVTWLEVIVGAPNKRAQQECLALLGKFQMTHLAATDQDWAMEKMLELRLRQGITLNDCLIASVSHRLRLPIYTHNVKDMSKLLPTELVIRPY